MQSTSHLVQELLILLFIHRQILSPPIGFGLVGLRVVSFGVVTSFGLSSVDSVVVGLGVVSFGVVPSFGLSSVDSVVVGLQASLDWHLPPPLAGVASEHPDLLAT